ncbi:hypothetical protein DUI87_10179 [Hirundo rustica rustica]|uniref:Uncharacterized protein n=1 Tax=Hirundo rustica rustica TaxID=333673 RepID=A0A3M0KHU3_HIRRU|nr:hypothetical protein DUI87_10179 [Hirundo rustica rustica]
MHPRISSALLASKTLLAHGQLANDWSSTCHPTSSSAELLSSPLSSAIQPVLGPPHSPFTQYTFPVITYKDIMGESVKSLSEVKLKIWTACPEHQGKNISELIYANSTESRTPSFRLVFEKFDYLILTQAKR